MANILAVDDEIEILKVIKRTLEREGHQITCCENTESIEKKQLNHYDMILLDIMMPGMDGFEFCRRIRNLVDCPIIFITAKTMDCDLEKGFSIGADDYLKKPFSIAELRARVNAHLRRQKREMHYKMVCEPYYFDLSSKTLFMGETPVKLTKSEYDICEFLAQNRGQVFSLEQILERVYGYDSDSDTSAIREHVKNIRAKLKNQGEVPIETVWGIGYKWS